MIRLASFIKIMAVAALPIFISCISKTPVEQKSFSENITIPDILKNSKDIEALVTKTESQINHQVKKTGSPYAIWRFNHSNLLKNTEVYQTKATK